MWFFGFMAGGLAFTAGIVVAPAETLSALFVLGCVAVCLDAAPRH